MGEISEGKLSMGEMSGHGPNYTFASLSTISSPSDLLALAAKRAVSFSVSSDLIETKSLWLNNIKFQLLREKIISFEIWQFWLLERRIKSFCLFHLCESPSINVIIVL